MPGAGPAPAPGDVAVVVNPVRARSRAALAVVRDLVPRAMVLPTTMAEPGASQARQALRAGCSTVVVIGGDGTLREVARALAGTPVAVGIVATGTANLLARNLGATGGDLHRLAAAALTGHARAVDLGRARLETAAGPVDEVFGVVCGLGHDARTLELVPARLKHHLGWPAYFGPAVVTMGAPRIPVTLRLDDHPPREQLLWSVLVGNATGLPGGTTFAPGAAPDDGLLDVVELFPRTPGQWARIAHRSLAHDPSDARGVRQRSARRVVVRPATPQPAQLDGDVVTGVRELCAWIDPGALLVRTADRAAPTLRRTGRCAGRAR